MLLSSISTQTNAGTIYMKETSLKLDRISITNTLDGACDSPGQSDIYFYLDIQWKREYSTMGGEYSTDSTYEDKLNSYKRIYSGCGCEDDFIGSIYPYNVYSSFNYARYGCLRYRLVVKYCYAVIWPGLPYYEYTYGSWWSITNPSDNQQYTSPIWYVLNGQLSYTVTVDL